MPRFDAYDLETPQGSDIFPFQRPPYDDGDSFSTSFDGVKEFLGLNAPEDSVLFIGPSGVTSSTDLKYDDTAKLLTIPALKITPMTTPGVLHNDNLGEIASSLIVNVDIASNAAIADSKLATISSPGKVANTATTANSGNSASSIVARDASGNFAANIITANLNGTASVAAVAINFSGLLAGNVTGPQGATVIANDVVTNTKLANMAANTIKGSVAGGDPADLTVAEVKSILGISGGVTIANTQIGFGNSSSNLVGSSKFTWDDVNQVLQLSNGSEINLGTSVGNRKLVLYSTYSDDFRFFGHGISGGTLKHRIDGTTGKHSFVCGVTSTTERELLSIGGNMQVSTMAGGGLVFGNSTSGYAPSVLDFYERGTTLTFALSGPWAAPRNLNFTFLRIGGIVLVTWPDLAPTAVTVAGQTISSAIAPGSVFIPAKFSPTIDPVSPILVYNNGSTGSAGDISSSNGANGRFFSIRNYGGTVFTGTAGITAGFAIWYV